MSLEERYSAIGKKKESDYMSARSEWQYAWQQMLIDSRLEAGDQGLGFELTPNMPTNNIYNWFFNRVRPLAAMISGHQRRNRKSSVVIPQDNADQETADQWTKIIMNIYKNEGVYETISEAFHKGSVISGLNFLQLYLDFTDDPLNGDLKVKRHGFSSIICDQNFVNLDLSDCRWLTVRTYMSPEDAIALLPNRTDDILSLNISSGRRSKGTKFEYMPQAFGNNVANLVAYDEYYYRTTRKQKKLYDRETGAKRDIFREDPEYLNQFLQENPSIVVVESDVPTVRMAISVQDKVLWEGPQPLHIDCFPFVPLVGFFNPELSYLANRLQGLVRSARDPQLLFNRRMILNAEIAESMPTSGFIFKESAIVDVKHLFNTGPGRFIPLKKDAQMTDIVPLPPPQIPGEYFTVQESMSKEISFEMMVNEEMMGISEDDTIAGVLAALRQSAGITTLQIIFDNLDRAQVILTERMMEIIMSNFLPGKIETMLGGEQPTEFFYNKTYGKYRCMVEAGFNTESQKQLEFAQLFQLKQLGVEIPQSALIRAATLQNKNDLIAAIEEQQQQQQQAEQAQMQAQQQLQQSQAMLAQARAGADEGLEWERKSRVPENRALAVQKLAEADKDQEIGLYNKVKMLKEIEEMDISHLEKLVTLAHMLQSSSVQQNKLEAQSLGNAEQAKEL